MSNFVDASTDEPGKVSDPFLYASGSNAAQAAKAKAQRIARIGKTVEFTLPGTHDLIAGGIVNLDGFRDGVNGEWLMKVVRHSVSRAGWITTVTGESPSVDESYRKPAKTKTPAVTEPQDTEPEE